MSQGGVGALVRENDVARQVRPLPKVPEPGAERFGKSVPIVEGIPQAFYTIHTDPAGKPLHLDGFKLFALQTGVGVGRLVFRPLRVQLQRPLKIPDRFFGFAQRVVELPQLEIKVRLARLDGNLLFELKDFFPDLLVGRPPDGKTAHRLHLEKPSHPARRRVVQERFARPGQVLEAVSKIGHFPHHSVAAPPGPEQTKDAGPGRHTEANLPGKICLLGGPQHEVG